jgi:hypothetical protein
MGFASDEMLKRLIVDDQPCLAERSPDAAGSTDFRHSAIESLTLEADGQPG